MTVVAIPAGITPDNTGMWGLTGFMANANLYSEGPVTTQAGTATGALAVPLATLLTGMVNMTTGSITGAFTINLPSTASILGAMPNIPKDGSYAEKVTFINNGTGQTGTLTAGDASTTITGTATVANNVVREYILNVPAGGATITLTNIGSKTL